jgi:hypothetical protein
MRMLGAVLLLALAGCATSGPSERPAPPAPAISTSVAPRSAPAISTSVAPPPAPAISTSVAPPPKEPTDLIKGTNLVVGTVTRGGSGPCFGLRDDDGTAYALHANARLELPVGKRVKVLTRPSRLRIDCGPGRLLEIVRIDVYP